MRKALVILIILIIANPIVTSEEMPELTDKIKDATSIEVKEKTSKALSTNVKIPDKIRPLAKIIFGIDENMPLSKFIIYLMFWLFVFLVILQSVKLMPFFKKGIIEFIAALAIAILASNLGGIETVVNLYYDLSIAEFISTASPGAFILAIVIIVVAYILLSRILRGLGNSLEDGQIENTAQQTGLSLRILNSMARVFGKNNDHS